MTWWRYFEAKLKAGDVYCYTLRATTQTGIWLTVWPGWEKSLPISWISVSFAFSWRAYQGFGDWFGRRFCCVLRTWRNVQDMLICNSFLKRNFGNLPWTLWWLKRDCGLALKQTQHFLLSVSGFVANYSMPPSPRCRRGLHHNGDPALKAELN